MTASPTARRARIPLCVAALIALVSALVVAPTATAAARTAHRELVVGFRAGTGATARARAVAASGTRLLGALPGRANRVALSPGASLAGTAARLRRNPAVAYAVPTHTARASAFYPNDPGFRLQWNFAGPFGIDMPEAWELASRRNAPGGRGAIVAVLDTGVAYRALGSDRRAPDLDAFVAGYDFVDDDPYPIDANGHGTHVAGTIAEGTNNRIGAAGIAYGARIMPVRTLDAAGDGDAVTIARGIWYAVRHHADVINMSLEFGTNIGARDVPEVLAALRYARSHGVLVTTVAGNEGHTGRLPLPARSTNVIAVAATTAHGCRARYSNAGPEVDVAAPGGGPDAASAGDAWDSEHCRQDTVVPSIYQETLRPDLPGFGLPSGYYGTSMAAPHVAGVAALIIASGLLGAHPSPAAVQQRIEQTARDLGPPGFDTGYGHGLIDAAAALR